MSITFPTIRWREEDRRKILIAIAISVFIHLLLIGSVTIAYTFRPITETPLSAEEKEPPELTFIAPPPPLDVIQPRPIDTPSYAETDKPPEKPLFQSDKNTRATSSAAPSGAAPLPSQEGEESRDIQFETKESTMSKTSQQAASSAQARQQPAQAQPAAAVQEAPPIVKPTPRQVSQLALLEPPKQQATPRPTPVQQNTPTPQQQAEARNNPTAPGFQPYTKITRIRGNLSSRGRGSVAAMSTPLGRYRKMMSDAIGSRWYYYYNNQAGLFNIGSVTISFIVDKSGKVSNIKVESNSSNESFAACSIQAIMDAEIPPIPDELAPVLQGDRIQIDYTFTILGN